MKILRKVCLIALLFLISSCATAQIETPLPTAVADVMNTVATSTPFQPLLPSALVTEASLFATPEQNPTQLASLYNANTIPALRTRTYGGGMVENVGEARQAQGLVRHAFQYPSDELTIYGVMTIPEGEGPFPIIIAIHGYAAPSSYASLNYSVDQLDSITRQGYIVIHPNMRNYSPSDAGDDRFRVGMSIDVLNFLAIIKEQAGQPGLLEKADAESIGLWAHSMGGEVALRVLTISSDVKAALLYAPLGGDSQQNAELLYNINFDPVFQEEINTPSYLFYSISPANFYFHVYAAIQLYHGTADYTVPFSVSEKTCEQLKSLGKDINCVFLAGADHTFTRKYSEEFYAGTFAFYAQHLKGE